MVFFGLINLVPLQTIYLDRSTCNFTLPTITPTLPPSPSTPPPTAEEFCNTLFNIANSVNDEVDILYCRVVVIESSCTSLVCELASNFNLYEIDMRFMLQESDLKAYVRVSSLQTFVELDTWKVTVSNEMRVYNLSSEEDLLIITLNATTNGLILEVGSLWDCVLLLTFNIHTCFILQLYHRWCCQGLAH